MRYLVDFFIPAIRSLGASKLYTLATVGIASVAIAALAAVASLNTLLLVQPLPYTHQADMISVDAQVTIGNQSVIGNSFAFASRWREQLGSAGTFVRVDESSARVRINEADSKFGASHVDQEFFKLFGGIDQGVGFDGIPTSELSDRIVVIDQDLRRKLFAVDEEPVGRFVQINGYQYRVIGVTEKAFRSPRILAGGKESLWLPVTPAHDDPNAWRGFNSNLRVFGRLAPGQNAAASQASLEKLTDNLMVTATPYLGDGYQVKPVVQQLRDALIGDSYKASLILLAATMLLSLLALSIVGTLFTARWNERQPILAVHALVGARAGDLRRLVSAEILAMMLLATLFAAPLSWVCILLIRHLSTGTIARLSEFSFNSALLFWLAGAGIAAALVLSWVVTRKLHSQNLIDAVRSGGKGAVSSGNPSIRQALLCLQLAALITTMHLGGLLLFDSSSRLFSTPGYEETGSSFIQLEVPASLRSAADKAAIAQEVSSAIRQELGFEQVAIVDMPPISKGLALFDVRQPDGRPIAQMSINGVGEGYLAGIGMQLLSGRLLQASDYKEHPDAIVLGEAAARMVANGRADAVGTQLLLDGSLLTVVGVVNNISNPVLRMEGAKLQGYLPFKQYDGVPTIAAFVFGQKPISRADVTRIAERVRPGLIVDEVMPTQQLRGELLEVYYSKAAISVALVLIAVVMAFSGIYSVMAYLFDGMRSELALRLAVGARWRDLSNSVTRAIRVPLYIASGSFLLLSLLTVSWQAAYFELDTPKVLALSGFSLLILISFVLGVSRFVGQRMLKRGYQGLLANL